MLHEIFGREMTDESCCCAHCGRVNRLGSVRVYLDAPGAVIRCPDCGSVLFVIVEHPQGTRIGFASVRWLESRAANDQ